MFKLKHILLLSLFYLSPIVALADSEVTHRHGKRIHSHVLPIPEQLNHRHGNGPLAEALQQSTRPAIKATTNGKTHIRKGVLNRQQVKPSIGKRGANLSAEAVFKKTSHAVWMLMAASRFGVSQGSAVAISSHHLLTNCHILQSSRAAYIVNIQYSDKPIPVSLFAADPQQDRCVLYTDQWLPDPVKVRPYDSLNIGEKVYTIGTPRGLSLTIAEGLLSSKREIAGIRLLQTSAAISQGSSGGGLFDASGNLLGITTLMMARGQNLNFAIPAMDYWD